MKELSSYNTVIPKHLSETSCFLGTRDLQMNNLLPSLTSVREVIL